VLDCVVKGAMQVAGFCLMPSRLSILDGDEREEKGWVGGVKKFNHAASGPKPTGEGSYNHLAFCCTSTSTCFSKPRSTLLS